MSAALRHFEVRVQPTDNGLSARLVRHGPSDILAIAKGRAIKDVVPLAGALFPICPRAHQGAALNALEQALGIELPSGQAHARDIVILAEALASCVWRSGIDWSKLLDRSPMTEPVKNARAASDALAESLFPNGWAQLGGAKLTIDQRALSDAIDTLAVCLDSAFATLPDLIHAADAVMPDPINPAAQTLESSILDMKTSPKTHALEETPRSLVHPEARSVWLRDWFIAQVEHGWHLLASLRGHAAALEPSVPGPEAARASGTGLGFAMTARGRLRHKVQVHEGKIEDWHVAAPTDWNFATSGSLVQYLNDLQTEAPASTAKWFVAALDPCAPCAVVLEEELAHA